MHGMQMRASQRRSPRPRAPMSVKLRIRRELAERFPNAILPKGAEKRPLKFGIDRDIIAACPDLNADEIRAALFDYCKGPKYLRNLIEGAERVDLDGNPVDRVDGIAAANAAEQLARSLQYYSERRRQ